MDAKFMELASRVTALEVQYAAHEEFMEHRLTSIEQLLREHRAQGERTNEALTELTTEITKYKSKFGGVILAVTCIWAFITGLPNAIWDWIKAGGVK